MKIIILNNEDGSVHIFDYDENVYNDAEDFFLEPDVEELKLRIGDCDYMVVRELNIQIH